MDRWTGFHTPLRPFGRGITHQDGPCASNYTNLSARFCVKRTTCRRVRIGRGFTHRIEPSVGVSHTAPPLWSGYHTPHRIALVGGSHTDRPNWSLQVLHRFHFGPRRAFQRHWTGFHTPKPLAAAHLNGRGITHRSAFFSQRSLRGITHQPGFTSRTQTQPWSGSTAKIGRGIITQLSGGSPSKWTGDRYTVCRGINRLTSSQPFGLMKETTACGRPNYI